MRKSIFYILPLFLLVLFNSCSKELSVSPEETYPLKNGVIIASNPDGAKIYINGKNTGYVTPDTVFWVESGSILITLKKELFKDSSLIVQVRETDTARVFMDFASNPTMFGKLYIDSNPRGGAIFLNDSALNKTTPATLTGIVPGYYNVTVKVPGYWDEKKIIPIRSVVTTYVDAQLVDTLVWINYNSERTPIPSDYLSSIAIESGYIKWVGSLDSGLFRYDDKTWTVYNMDNSILPDNSINSVGVDYFGNLWVCTNYGVVKKNGDNWTLYNTQNSGLPDDKVLTVSFDGVNTCFGTWNKGLVIFNGINWINYNKLNSPLPSNQVNMVLYHGDYLWACTPEGLAKIKDTTWSIINYNNSTNIIGGGGPGGPPRPSGFPNNNCKTIAVDRNGKPWVGFGKESGSSGGSSYLRIGTIWRTYHGKPSDEVFDIDVDMNNVKWFGSSENGLSKLDGDKWTHYNMSNSKIRSDRIFGIIIDQNGYKWMASYGAGLIKYKGN